MRRASFARALIGLGLRRRRTVLSCRIGPDGDCTRTTTVCGIQFWLLRVDEVGVERQHVDAPAMARDFAGEIARRRARCDPAARS